MSFPRSSGILLHPTSLPGRFGIGDLGNEAYNFIDFLASSGQRLWQVLPLGPTGYGDSPYQCFSAFAGNPLLVSPDLLINDRLLSDEDLRKVPAFRTSRVDFGNVIDYKKQLLGQAFENFKRMSDGSLRSDFESFCHQTQWWLEDYALFRALKEAHAGVAWTSWEPQYAARDTSALAAAREGLRDKIEAEKFVQFLFFKQWSQLKSYCRDRRIRIIGDAPIFVAFDSADVWANPEQFKLDKGRQLTVQAGVPPDYFSKTGQLWGNPIYDWNAMRGNGFRWWIDRLRATFEMVDILRIDHFRGFSACWEVPGQDKTAEHGRWVDVPGKELFTTLRNVLGEMPIIAEDLGVITPDVEALRDDFGFPGMRVLQFAFRGDSKTIDLPHNYVRNCVVYTGTHDNDTTAGWFNSKAGLGSTRSAADIERERAYCLEYLDSNGREIHWDLIRAAWSSVADTAVVPLQDVLGLGSRARMNLPASEQGNWQWRYRAGALTQKISERLRRLTELYGRAGN
ncbi:MAG TPA: 4-alpha-glucanotransferase [Blastocatellia bacterium]|nr:4-alpha-glucanotransferase [Blastocatellia bacterium]